MSALRPELSEIVKQLVSANRAAGEVSIDALGDAIGTSAVSYVEVDAMIDAIEAQGLCVAASTEPRGEADLRVLLPAVRQFSAAHGRRPNLVELSHQVGLPLERVKHALLLARIMQR